MADTTISGLSRILSTDTSAIIPISIAGVTYGIPVSAIITAQGSMGNDAFQLPVGTSSNRPAAATVGDIRYNTTIGNIEYYNGTRWSGDIISGVEILVVGGGGSGGRSTSWAGAGGGAGGLIETTVSLTPGVQYSVIVGVGGTAPTVQGNRGGSGQDSAAVGVTALGGGGGGGYYSGQQSGANGGSGGGGSYDGSNPGGAGGLGTAGQGFNGGDHNYGYGDGAGGGGAGAAGGLINYNSAGYPAAGGAGKISSINGNATYYAGGGGGGAHNSSSPSPNGGIGGGGAGGSNVSGSSGSAGIDGLGGGGGGGGNTGGSAGRGGNGIVIIAYPGNVSKATITGAGASTSTTSRPGYVVHTFNVGSSTFTYTG